MSNLLERLLAPGTQLMQRVRLPVKFAIISTAFLVPLCVAVYGVVSYSMSNIDFAEQELLGTAYVQPLNELITATAGREAASGGDTTSKAERALDQVRAIKSKPPARYRATRMSRSNSWSRVPRRIATLWNWQSNAPPARILR